MRKIEEIQFPIKERQEVKFPVGAQLLGWRGIGEDAVAVLVMSYVHENRTQNKVIQMVNSGEAFEENLLPLATVIMEDEEKTPVHILEEPVRKTVHPLRQPRTRG